MIDKQFTSLLQAVIVEVNGYLSSYETVLEQMQCKNEEYTQLYNTISKLNESIGTIGLGVQYLIFDLESTIRERDKLRMILEDKE